MLSPYEWAAWATLVIGGLPILALALTVGCCEPRTVVASEDLGLVRMEHNGVPGWWAPQATMAELMQTRRAAAAVKTTEDKP